MPDSTLSETIIDLITVLRAAYAQEHVDHGYRRSPRRYLWTRADDGWVPTRELHDPQLTAGERKRLSRAILAMIAAGQLEGCYDAGGRVREIRVPPAKTRRGRR